MRKMIEDNLDRLADEDKLIKTGDELIARRSEIEAHVAKKETEDLIREAEDAMHGDDVPEGFHVGELGGLEGDEREEALLTDEEEQSSRERFSNRCSTTLPTSPTAGSRGTPSPICSGCTTRNT